MRQSAFAKYDNRTPHERYCDYIVAKSSKPKFYGGIKPIAKTTERLSNYELKQMLENVLTTY